MQIPKDAMLLRIFFGENDRFEHQPLSEAIVLKARETSCWSHGSARPIGVRPFQPPSHSENLAPFI
jgi:hypothetical protein